MKELKTWGVLLLRPFMPISVFVVGMWIWGCWQARGLVLPTLDLRLIGFSLWWLFTTPVYWIFFVVLGNDDLLNAIGLLLDRLPPRAQVVRKWIGKTLKFPD